MIGPDNMPVLPEGYGYCWYLDGEKVWVLEGGTPVDTDRLDSGYRGLIPNISAGSGTDVSKIRVLLAVRDVIVENPYGYSRYTRNRRSCIFWDVSLSLRWRPESSSLLRDSKTQ